MTHVIIIGSYVLDPRFKEHGLSPEDTNKGHTYLKTLCGESADWMLFVADFIERRHPFHTDMFNSKAPPTQGLRIIANSRKCEVQAFSKFAVGILALASTAVSVERSFSAVRVIHGRLRCSMSSDSLEMSVYCYWNDRTLLRYGRGTTVKDGVYF